LEAGQGKKNAQNGPGQENQEKKYTQNQEMLDCQ
jgi:hypothetical protein